MKIHISITTPEQTLIETEADEVIIPTTEGEISVLPHHVPLLTQLAQGELIIKQGTTSNHLAVVGGFVELGNNKISILADFGIHAGDINERYAQEAKDRAQKLLEGKLTEEDYAKATADLERAIAQLKVIQKIRKPH